MATVTGDLTSQVTRMRALLLAARAANATIADMARRADALVALTHYAPVPETLVGEPLEIYAFLGCYQLGQAIDSASTALALHGHAHHGSERGRTAGGARRPGHRGAGPPHHRASS